MQNDGTVVRLDFVCVSPEIGDSWTFALDDELLRVLLVYLKDVGAVAWQLDPEEPFPEPVPDAQQFDEEGYPLTEEAEQWKVRLDAWQRITRPDGLIPAYKLASPDGWVLSGEECALMVSKLRILDPETLQGIMLTAQLVALDQGAIQRKDMFYVSLDDARVQLAIAQEFATFCESCMQHGGVRVVRFD